MNARSRSGRSDPGGEPKGLPIGARLQAELDAAEELGEAPPKWVEDLKRSPQGEALLRRLKGRRQGGVH